MVFSFQWAFKIFPENPFTHFSGHYSWKMQQVKREALSIIRKIKPTGMCGPSQLNYLRMRNSLKGWAGNEIIFLAPMPIVESALETLAKKS